MLNQEYTAKLNIAYEIIESVLRENAADYNEKAELTAPEIVANLFKTKIGFSDREHFVVAFLNTQHHLIECEVLFSGTINESKVYIREIVKKALLLNAAAIIIGHNHPSGKIEPSYSDRALTERINEACKLLDIKLLDHIIVSGNEQFYSFAERSNLLS
ncbi:DNA repair protein RadC [Glaesserella parasuis]|uniref:RadC family protein n=2 Tax=Glaesserella parasuis TaxID=738 RepID=UPI00094F5E47|nr:DNA repair protein RadC [Glaesserella parasuis]MCT8756567.1 DNA repair protein RadC [Glaesserella parasuis]MCT8760466.1 DNA repair protein RadC [Glaesserella parasuis]MCT8766596.1 DNA repair protein RadC [Glaesserella parasuis]MDD2170382.1 DNA repair protein RadC [Glaesserella parasuis]MDG6280391.1 DNA repair protein RadC [Glaesserella parasuis]